MLPAVIGQYRIVRPLGAGGMGEVFLAEDAKLGRSVALKVLPRAFAADPDRRDRFEREARALAALNHPNIITIYSIEEQQGILFLTMELVEGKTLAELTPRQGMPIEQWMKMAIALTDAVGAAHQRGITHRDLKPANVMVSDEGRVKVLDFGLAKREPPPLDGVAATIGSLPLTSEGSIIGTVDYMSPEQAQGRAVDARSDVFSLGILLFEMVTGERPFKGDTNLAVLSSILKDTPASVTDLRQELPRDVGRILKRCLAKGPEDRYQTAKELHNDLRSLKDDLDTGAVARDRTPSQISQTGPLPPSVLRTRSTLLVTLIAVALVVAAGGWWYARRRATAAAPAFVTIAMRQLTNTGQATLAAISPDGRYVVHVDGSFDKPSLWMRQVSSTASSAQIAPPTEGEYEGLAFSPDGEAVLYVFRSAHSTVGSLFKIPLLGGVTPRKLVDDIDTAPAFSPDGTRMAFIRGIADGGQAIMLANADGTGERPLASRAEPDVYFPTRVAWSPDGTLIAAFAGFIPRQRSRIVLVNVATGKEQPFSDARFDYGGQLVWLGDASALVFDAIEQGGGRWNTDSQLWAVAYPSGTLRRINSDVASYAGVAAVAGGRTLVAVRDEVRAGLWVAPEGDSARARPIIVTSNGLEGAGGIDWTPDGRIVYSARTQGSIDIWVANADGSRPRQLTSDPGLETHPQVLPDGKGIVFSSRASGTADVQVWAMDLDGGNRHQIATGSDLLRGRIQAVGDHVYFKALHSGRPVDYRVPIGGGPREPLFPDRARLPQGFVVTDISPDEHWAVGTYAGPQSSGLAVVPIVESRPARTFPYTYTPGLGFGATWAPGGHALEDLVFRNGATNLWRFPLDGSAPTAVTTFTSDHLMNYRWSRDGRTLAMSRGTESADVVLITSVEKNE